MKKRFPLFLLAFVLIASSAIVFYYWYDNREEVVTHQKTDGGEMEDTMPAPPDIYRFTAKKVWANAGIWIPKLSYVQVTAEDSQQPFETSLGGKRAKSVMSSGVFMTRQALAMPDYKTKISPLSLEEAGGFDITPYWANTVETDVQAPLLVRLSSESPADSVNIAVRVYKIPFIGSMK